MKLFRQLVWLICFGAGLAACGQNGVTTPTAVPPPLPSPISTELPPTDTPTAVPSPTHTAVPIPTATAKPLPTPEPTDTAVPTQTEITIDQPTAGSELIVGQEVTINGRAFPAPTEPLMVQISVAGNMDLLNETAVVDAAGNWSVTAVLSPTIVGPANITARLASSEAVNTVTLVPDTISGNTTISVVRPVAADTAVAGYTILFEGRVSNPVDDSVTISVLDNECNTAVASQKFTVSGGSWIGYTIIPDTTTPGPACAIAYTGTRGTADGREARTPMTILSPDDDEAVILQLGYPSDSDIPVKAGENSYLFGLAINAPENAVNIRLESDNPGETAQLITSATAFADQYGYWGIDLEIPADAHGTAVLYITIGSSSDPNYREIRLPVTIQQ